MISGNIQDLITMAKNMPNGESRNSMISRLKDARAHAIVMEGELSTQRPKGLGDASTQRTMDVCTCPKYPVAVSVNCPQHGSMKP